MRHRNPQPAGSTARDLARLLAAWLVLVLLLQGLSATLSLVHGPAHRHSAAAAQQLGWAHAQAHEHGLKHHHDSHERTLPGGGEADDLDASAVVLLAVLLPLSARFDWAPAQGRELLPAYAPDVHADAPAGLPRKPPRV